MPCCEDACFAATGSPKRWAAPASTGASAQNLCGWRSGASAASGCSANRPGSNRLRVWFLGRQFSRSRFNRGVLGKNYPGVLPAKVRGFALLRPMRWGVSGV